MTDQKLVDELEKALRDEAYDGGFGYMGNEQFTAYVRTLAETAAEVVEKAHTPTDDERAIFDAIADRLGEHSQATNYEIADSGEYETKLRGPVDVEVLAEWLLPTVLGFRRSEVPEPSEMVVKVASALIEADYPGEGDVLFRNHAMLPYVERAEVVAAALRGEPALVPTTKGWKLQPVSELPEPSTEPTCEHGSPLSALCEYAARYASGETDDAETKHARQGEPSDAQRHAQARLQARIHEEHAPHFHLGQCKCGVPLGDSIDWNWHLTGAALRAAGVVTQEGESRG